MYVGFEVFTAVGMKSIIFWDMTPCSPLSSTHLLTRLFAELFFDPEDGGDTFLRNVGCYSTDYTASYPRRWYSLYRCNSVIFLRTPVTPPSLPCLIYNALPLRQLLWHTCYAYSLNKSLQGFKIIIRRAPRVNTYDTWRRQRLFVYIY
jgi:hypothetical protein